MAEGGVKAQHDAYYDLKIHSGDTLSDEYVQHAQQTVRQQLALGGYRLADWLMGVFGKKATLESE